MALWMDALKNDWMNIKLDELVGLRLMDEWVNNCW